MRAHLVERLIASVPRLPIERICREWLAQAITCRAFASSRQRSRATVLLADDVAIEPSRRRRSPTSERINTPISTKPLPTAASPKPTPSAPATFGALPRAADKAQPDSHGLGLTGGYESRFPVKIDVQGGVPIHLYTDDVDEGTRQQLHNLARSKMPVGFVAAMPDVHLGKGATIGSVFASRDYVCPNAVGVDIGCGMCAVPLEGPLLRRDVSERKLISIQKGLRNSIPTGFESHGKSTPEMKATIQRLVSEHRPTSWLRQTLTDKHAKQLGTLGGGNHFVELVYDEDDRVWMMLHSGSRNIGNVTAQHYDGVAAKQCNGKKEALAYLRINSKEGKEYLTDMKFCQDYALNNRRFMMEAFDGVLKKETGKSAIWDRMVNIHHNYCECEQCRYYDEVSEQWREEKLWVTRKGATSAKQGQLGIIPGSMGTGSYIVRGRGTSESWQSCSHGAGRSMSRNSAFKHISQQAFVDHMKNRGIVWDSRFADRVKDEAPMAYKDLNEVMRNQSTLVEIVHHLQPLVNMKGF